MPEARRSIPVDERQALPKTLRMSVRHSHTSIDCHDAFTLSQWWRRILDYEMDPEDPNLPGHEECAIHDLETGHTLLFLEVPDGALPAKRIHLDVRPRERTQEQEILWLQQQGAVAVADHRGQYGPGTGWLTMADPEGNQFCVLRSDAERAAMDSPPDIDGVAAGDADGYVKTP